MRKLNVLLLSVFSLTNCVAVLSSDTQSSVTTALPGTVLNFTCECQGYVAVVFNNTYTAHGNNLGDKFLADKAIHFEKYTDGSRNGYRIEIVASFENSGTYFSCYYGSCPHSEHHLYTVEGPPSPPESPLVSVEDQTTLSLSWTAPWSFPINNYTLRMFNASSSELMRLWTTSDTELLVKKVWSSDCDQLIFTVEADTDVGPTGPSQPAVTGFPTVLKGQELSTKTQLLEQTSREVILSTTFQMPKLCHYEFISFTIVAHNHNTLYGSETWGHVDAAKDELVVKQVVMATPGNLLSVTLSVYNSLGEHLQKTNSMDIQRVTELNN